MITLVLVLFGEIIPKVHANKNKFLFIRFSYNVIVVSKAFFYPIIQFLIKIGSVFRGQIKKESYVLMGAIYGYPVGMVDILHVRLRIYGYQVDIPARIYL